MSMRPTLVQVEAPDPVVSSADAQLRIAALADVDYAIVDALLAAATARLDGPTGVLGRALGVQTWDMKWDGYYWGAEFPNASYVSDQWLTRSHIKIPLPPLISVDSVTYLDDNGDEQTWATDNYRVTGIGGQGRVVAISGWPSVGDFADALTVRFTAGYTSIPDPIQLAIMLSASDLNATMVSSSSASAGGGSGIKRKSVLNGLIDITYFSPAENSSSSTASTAPAAPTIEALIAGYRVF